MQLPHDYALKIPFTKREGLSGSPFEAYKFSLQRHALNKKTCQKSLMAGLCFVYNAALTIAAKESALRLAPPIKPPSISD